jgi:hypothetical protein
MECPLNEVGFNRAEGKKALVFISSGENGSYEAHIVELCFYI